MIPPRSLEATSAHRQIQIALQIELAFRRKTPGGPHAGAQGGCPVSRNLVAAPCSADSDFRGSTIERSEGSGLGAARGVRWLETCSHYWQPSPLQAPV